MEEDLYQVDEECVILQAGLCMVRQQLRKTGMTLVCSRCFMLPAKVPSWAGKGGCSKVGGEFAGLSQRELGPWQGSCNCKGHHMPGLIVEVSHSISHNLISTAARLTSLLRYIDVNLYTIQQPEVACETSQII